MDDADLELLADHVRLRFTRLRMLVGGISQKMLTQTLRHMEADVLVTRTVFPVVLPRVEYELTSVALSLGAGFCGVWQWAAAHRMAIEQARTTFNDRLAI
jgi:DNA-binding HxlR family transcriptional regulator